jgi:MFS family permease
VLLAMSTWFSASAVVPQVTAVWGLTTTTSSLLTIAVQLGFVTGALLSAGVSLTDVVRPRVVIALGGLGAAVANLGLLVVDSAVGAVLLRGLTGLFLAGVYPPAMKAMATWFRAGRGLALGTMVGALTVGSALPHLVNGLGGLDWRVVIVATSATTVAGALLALVGRDGPFAFPRAPFDPRAALRVLGDRRVRLAAYGYLGHMWELYAMWTWVAAYLAASFTLADVGDPGRASAFGAFAAIGIGGLGCVVGGAMSDRRNRPWAASLALTISGTCAVLAGPLFGRAAPLVVVLVLVWGFWVVADSALFSAIVTEVADQRYVGTAVTLQLALGFTLTVVTIWLVPLLVDIVGWRWSFLVLLPGPVAGIAAMRALTRLQARPVPEAAPEL